MTVQSDRATYRIIVFGVGGTEVLLKQSHSGVRFPDVTIARWGRVVEKVSIGMKRQWGKEVICLFELRSPRTTQPGYMVARYWRESGASAAHFQWLPTASLSHDSFEDPDDYTAIQESLGRRGAPDCDANPGPFAQLNWFDELTEWVGRAIAPKGLYLTGNFRQLNASPTFSLVRFETIGPAVWFKAVGAPNEQEFPITLWLAKSFPKYSPELVAARSDWNGWLMCEASGVSLSEGVDLSLWNKTAAELAKLQIESITNCGSLLASGAHDLRAGVVLPDRVPQVMDVIAELMPQQPKVSPPVLSTAELALLATRIRRAMCELQNLGIPDTLGHLDLNPGNTFVAAGGCVFLDWAEAYIGHPFFSFQYLLQHFRRINVTHATAEAAFTAAYLFPWTRIVPSKTLSEAMALAPLLAAFAYAAASGVGRKPESLQDLKLAGYLRSLARRMNREADQLSEKGAVCLS